MRTTIVALCGGAALVLAALVFAPRPNRVSTTNERKAMSIPLVSSAFTEGQPIPAKYTCDGRDVSPPLQWSQVPSAAKSLALICDDPDAPMGTWVHWVLYDLPASTPALAEAVPAKETLPSGAKQGRNDFRKIGYGGPCPPAGRPHRYYFKLYALDGPVGLEPGASKQDLLRALTGHILGEGQLMGTYQRK
jgi:Raf kinase inhibitor-like YbhB/YbcL family protein